MQSSHNRMLAAVTSVAVCFTLIFTLTYEASAQGGRGGGGGGFGGTTSRVQLASIELVQNELKMSDEQKTAAKEISDNLSEESRALRGGGGGGGGGNAEDRAARMEEMGKLTAEADEKLAAKLEDAQKQRLTELFVQINGAAAIMDTQISEALNVTEEQQKDLAEANTKNREARMEAFQNFRDMSAEERTEATAEFTKESNETVMAVLNDEQREQFGKMKGADFEIDRTLLRRGGRGGAGGGRRQGGGNN